MLSLSIATDLRRDSCGCCVLSLSVATDLRRDSVAVSVSSSMSSGSPSPLPLAERMRRRMMGVAAADSAADSASGTAQNDFMAIAQLSGDAAVTEDAAMKRPCTAGSTEDARVQVRLHTSSLTTSVCAC